MITQQLLQDMGAKSIREHSNHFMILCPVHQENHPSCGVDKEKGIWHCFSCGASGTLYNLMNYFQFPEEKFSQYMTEEILLFDTDLETIDWVRKLEGGMESVISPYMREWKTFSDFTYQTKRYFLDHYFYDLEVLNDLEVGFDLTKNAIIYPFRGEYGDHPMLGLTRRCMQEKKHRTFNHFQKGDHLYGFWKLPPHMDFLIVVEGEMDLLKVRQFGCQNVVSLSGCCMSKIQRDYLVNLNVPILLALDGDKAGKEAMKKIADLLMPTVTVFEIKWGEYKDFGSVSSLSEFQKIIANKSLTLETAYAMIRNIK